MPVLDFSLRLREVQADRHSVLCVGLDPDPERLPRHLTRERPLADAVVAFNRAIIEATEDVACAYKLNLAFYEALGREGWHVLEETIEAVPRDLFVIADGKRGDIGNSARFYAEAVFEMLGCDACTVSPYMGRDSVEPFLAYEGKATFVLGRTTNSGAADFQEKTFEGEPLYARVARQVQEWNDEAPGTAGLVAGATDTESLESLRRTCPSLPFLIPGVGAQGGSPSAVMQAAATDEGAVLVNSSRSILYASAGKDFAEAAAWKAEALRDSLAPFPLS